MKIPRKDVIKMIELCYTNISQFLSDARLIHSQKPRFDHSIAFVQFAIEELGKASILKKKLQETEGDVIKVPDKLLGGRGSHQLKEREAWTILNPKLRVLAKGIFNPKIFDPKVFATRDIELSHKERLRCVFVGYEKGVPTLGVAVKSENLEKLIKGIEKEVESLRHTKSERKG